MRFFCTIRIVANVSSRQGNLGASNEYRALQKRRIFHPVQRSMKFQR